MLANTAVKAAGIRLMKAKGRIGISDTIAKDKPVRAEDLTGDHESSCVRPTSSPTLSSDVAAILENTLFAMISASFSLNLFVWYSTI